MDRCRQRKAFTIVEMVIVIAVIAILAAVLIPTISGVIRMANISADKQFAASLNIQLAMESVDREILNENDLKEVIDKYYGADFFENELAPKSADYGYYFWYDYTNKNVTVGTVEEITELATQTPSDPTLSAVPMVGGRKTFSPASLRSDLIPGYYLMGCKGGVLNTIKTMEGLDDEQDYEDTLNQLKATEDTLEKTLYEKITVTTIETDYGIFACEGEQEYWYRSVTTTVVEVKTVYVYYPDKVVDDVTGIVEEVDRDPVNPPITVAPGGIEIEISSDTKVDIGAWAGLFGGDGKVAVHVDVANKEELKDIFHLGAMDGNMVIVVPGGVLPNGNECHFNPNDPFEIVDSNNNTVVEVGGMESLNVEIVYNNSGNLGTDADYFYEGTLYLAWDFGSAKLSLKDKLSNSLVNWTVSDGALIQVSPKGEITLKEDVTPDAQKSFATVTATLKKDPAKTHSINVQLVFPTSLTWKLDGTQYSAPVTNGAFTLTYTEATDFALALDAVGATQSGYVKLNNTEFAINFATSGDLFKIENNTLKLDPAKIATKPTQTLTVTYGTADHTYISQTYTVTVKDNSSVGLKKNQIATGVTMGDYLFRVGNGNSFTLGKLFSAVTEGKAVKVESVNIYDASRSTGINSRVAVDGANGFAVTYTANSNWANGTIKFSGTGVAIIEVVTAKGATELAVEVVDGKNVFAAGDFTGATNYVLMNNITWGTANKTAINGTLYGNGFAINAQNFTNATQNSNNALFYLNGGTIDNLVINGPVYPELIYQSEVSSSKPYYVMGIYTTGDAAITNSYISGFRSPVMANGTSLYLENTTLVGGNYANLWLQAGKLTLKDVTTVQKETNATVADTSKKVLGAGVIANSGVSASNITVIGNLTQYNWVTKSQASSYMDSDVSSLINTFFNNSTITHTVGGTNYINAGIVFQGTVGTVNNASQTAGHGYSTQTISGNLMGVKIEGLIYTRATTGGAITSVPTYGGYTPNAQATIKPVFRHNVSLTNGAVNLKLVSGSATLTLPDYTVSKYSGQSIAVNITCSGATVADKKITFTKDGIYTVTYTVADNWFFNADGTKNVQSVSDTYTITVVVTKAEHKDAVIDVSGVDKTIYYGYVGKTTDPDYEYCFAVLKGLKIKDYNEDGSSFDVTVDAGSLPSGLTVKATTATYFDKVVIDNSVYYMADNNPDNNRDQAHNVVFTYTYTGKNGKTVTATVSHSIAKNCEATKAYTKQTSGGGCVTPDTLVTLADGTQKEIQYVTYADQLLVWNFYTGKYDVMPAAIVMNHGYANYTVTSLSFSDGTSVNTINGHGFFDVAENKYVIINDANAADHVGHEFVKVNGDGYTTVTLENYHVATEYTESWSILTAGQYNCILENMWTLTPAEVEGSPDYLMPFEIGEDMKYDEAEMQADIEKYGLYTYEDFAEYCAYEQFVGFGFANFKVSVEKGYITWDDIEFLLNLHLGGTK